jgi:iron complex transport system substrate-binding protein
MRASLLLATLLAASTALAGEQTLTDDTGRSVSVPEHPQRVVVMHEPLLGLPLMELSVNVVGSYGRKDDGTFITAVDFVDTVFGPGKPKPRGIGAVGQIDLERLRALKPDLIVGTELDVDKTERLSTVAPVYLQKVSTGKAHGFSVEAELAKVVNREDAFAARKVAYDEKVKQVKALLPSAPQGKTYLAVFITDQLNAMGDMSGAIQALEDLGYKRLALTQENAPSGQGGSMLIVPLNAETFGRLNPDLLVLMNSYMSNARDEAGTAEALEKIVPGWKTFLTPAREGRVLYLDSAEVAMPTVASAEHTLDAVADWAKR